MTRYKIFIKFPDGTRLVYSVDKYEVINNGFIQFLDKRTNKTKQYPIHNCEIEVIE